MTDPVASCELIGRWRVVKADLWDRDYLDMVEPAYLQIGRDGWAEFAFGCVTAGGELEYSQTIVFFRRSGFDEGDEVSRDGSAELQTMAQSRSDCPSTTATTPSSPAAGCDFFNGLLGGPTPAATSSRSSS
jgi:hypothetical protein